MKLAARLLDLAHSHGMRSIVVVGTGKNVGKTVVVRALCESAWAADPTLGLTSIGRDGEAFDVSDALAKPRLFLRQGTLIATARAAVPATPACEIVDLSNLHTAIGDLLYARVRTGAYYEIAGPPTAWGIRAVIERLFDLGCSRVIVDGAVDRIAALAGGKDGVIVATGAAAGATPQEAVENITALVRRLGVPIVDSARPMLRIDGALTAEAAAAFSEARERRQIVVRDPTQITFSAKAFLRAAERLDLRCERPLTVIAATVASIGRERYFEPDEFARRVAQATALPTFDLYTGKATAA
ncbi:MAG: hypothetical protein ABI182_03815 [Candidatus Baltobacteraceae bacterium]